MALASGFDRNEDGSVLVEFAVVLPLFLILLFAVIDFGQIYLRWILAEKATQTAARVAVVRPPLCAGVPTFNDRAAGAPQVLPFGTSCAASPGLCSDPGTFTCTGATAVGDGFDAIEDLVGGFLPASAAPANVQLTYSFADLGFLGGPYVPMVTVDLVGEIDVPFITPLGPLLQAFYGGNGLEDPTMPSMRATLPAEDLSEGGPG
ncbi:MAG: TadE/TadG family type IV pilus assembly protein [Pseudomonadota bacterium]